MENWKDREIPVRGGRTYRVRVDGESFEVVIEDDGKAGSPRSESASVAAVGTSASPASSNTSPAATEVSAIGGGSLTAPMPGIIADCLVKPGDPVQAGDVVVLFEAMKMENAIEARVSGVVSEVFFRKGDTVPKDAMLLTIVEAARR